MKKLVLSCLILILGLSVVMASESAGSWSSDADNKINATGDSAKMTVSFDLSSTSGEETGNEAVTIGFSTSAVDDLATEVTGQSTATLSNQDGFGKLSEDRYIFWQISSPSKLQVSLSWPAVMTGGTETNKLIWTITTSSPENDATNGTTIAQGDNTAQSGSSNSKVVLDRQSGFKYGTVGSQKLEIVTASLDNATIDTYTADLTLTVKTV